MAILLDTSFLIALNNERDVHHPAAKTLWPEIEKEIYGKYFISDHIFDEIVAVTMRKAGKERAKLLGHHLLQSVPLINLDTHLFEETWKLFTQIKQNLSFTDCSNLILLQLINSNKIATFDKTFREIKNLEVLGKN